MVGNDLSVSRRVSGEEVSLPLLIWRNKIRRGYLMYSEDSDLINRLILWWINRIDDIIDTERWRETGEGPNQREVTMISCVFPGALVPFPLPSSYRL